MTAGPAPRKNDWTVVLALNPVEMWSAGQYEEERRGEHDQRREQSPANSIGDVAHRGDRLDDRARRQLSQGHGA